MTSAAPAYPLLRERLAAHQTDLSDTLNMRELLAQTQRFSELSFTVEGTLFDFSKHLVTSETVALLKELAESAGIEKARDRMFAGEKINTTENRAVLHTALRAPAGSSVLVDGENVIPYIHSVLERMRGFCRAVIDGTHTGYTGKKITDVVNIGIGGSDLGPRFVVEALQDYHTPLRLHFVSNIDGAAITRVLNACNPETTLFIIASKTFTTEETMLNASVAKDWFVSKSGSTAGIAKHFTALSTNEPAVAAFGITPDLTFPFRDWVGGRYSLWSAIGLSIMLAVGPDHFDRLLAGAYAMDQHFRSSPLERNVPVLMALLGIWYRNFWNYPAHLMLPYDDRLQHISKYAQQMDMESNGKSVCKDGSPAPWQTAPLLYGEPGTDSQHSFMQLVHQGTTPIPADFIVCAKPHHTLTKNHLCLLTNFLAQSRALAIGQTLAEAKGDPFRVFSGNRPSTSMILPELSPFSLGLLLAAYEHKIFVQGVIWNINSFDQPGVELGKKIAQEIATRLNSPQSEKSFDSSTEGLLKAL